MKAKKGMFGQAVQPLVNFTSMNMIVFAVQFVCSCSVAVNPPVQFVCSCSAAVNPPVCFPSDNRAGRTNILQVVRNNDLENMHLLESADEWPFLREVVGKGDGGEAEEKDEGQQEHLLCDAIMGEPFFYRVGYPAVPPCFPSR